jgi:adenylate cyclase
MASARRPAVLVVEDESIVAHDIQQTVKDLGYDAFAVASSAEEALRRAGEKRPDVALVDVRIKGRTDGIKAAQLLQDRFGVPVIYLTAHADDATLKRAKQTRPSGYLVKPVKPAELKSALAIAVFKGDADDGLRGAGGSSAPAASPSPETAAARPGRPPGARAVRRQLEAILGSADFDASRRSREFLRFIVEETLAGSGEDLTQPAIATRVFARKDDFDAVVDPIVRIQAGRLRRSLERYYLLSGSQAAVRIELPRGTYVPAFRAQEKAAEAVDPPPPAAAPEPSFDEWPAVLVSLFEGATSGPDHEPAAARLQEELVLEMGRYGHVRALRERHAEPREPARGARFFLGGRVWYEERALRVSARLVDLATGEQVWGDKYHTAPGPGRWSGTRDDVARVVAARVGGEEGVITQVLASEYRKRRPAAVTPYGALLLSYEFFLARDPASLAPALAALRQVVTKEPDCAPAWTRLARVCLANYAFEVTPITTPIDEAISAAQQGVRLDPTSRLPRCILASCLLVKDELAAARDELEQALRLAPDSLVYLEIIGYLLTMLGEGERGPALIRTARERNPHCLPHALFGLWFDHLRRGEVELAYQAALEYRDPTFFWRGVLRVSCLGLLGRAEEAAAEVAEIVRAKPDFSDHGRTLIGYYVKDPAVRERVVDGLARAGLKLA